MLKPLGVFLQPDVLLQREDIQAGDLLEIDRKLYCHWAVYVGNGEVVHLPESMEGLAVVERCLLQSMVQDGLVRVNNKQVAAKEKELAELPGLEVVKRAISCVGTTVPYNIVTNNGEHFVTKLKYGLGWSDQARVMRASLSSLSQPPTSPVEMQKVHLDLFSEIQTILGSSPPVSGPCSPPLRGNNPPLFLYTPRPSITEGSSNNNNVPLLNVKPQSAEAVALNSSNNNVPLIDLKPQSAVAVALNSSSSNPASQARSTARKPLSFPLAGKS